MNQAVTRIHPLSEKIFDEIVSAAGGRRLNPDHHRAAKRNADFMLGGALIELKILEDEGFGKEERHLKLAALFAKADPDRPVLVLDPALLPSDDRRAYDRAIEGPIKQAVRSARRQLRQSRCDHPDASLSVLMIVNSGNAALDHDEILRLAEHRARNDSEEIDGIIVAGAYLHSDGFDTVALWPINYVPIRLDRPFPEYDALHQAFHDYAERAMTRLVRETPEAAMTKGPVVDTGFDVAGKTFVKPAPPFGTPSEFFVRGRPRGQAPAIPPVATIYPELSRAQWARFKDALPDEARLGARFEDWLQRREQAICEATVTKPLVPIPVTFDQCMANRPNPDFESLGNLAAEIFHAKAIALLEAMCEIQSAQVVARRFILAETEEIGQDERNDVSHIVAVELGLSDEPRIATIAANLRLPHLHACALAAAYALKTGAEAVHWAKDQRYAWI